MVGYVSNDQSVSLPYRSQCRRSSGSEVHTGRPIDRAWSMERKDADRTGAEARVAS